MPRNDVIEVSVTVAEHYVVLRQSNRSVTAAPRLLGREVKNGWETLWLDRIVHRPNFKFTENWCASGAISTILQRPLPDGAQQMLSPDHS